MYCIHGQNASITRHTTTPFIQPHSILFMIGSPPMGVQFVERDQTLQALKNHLSQTQERAKKFADKPWRELVFQVVGDSVKCWDRLAS